jgi:hypothetical protein
MTTLPASWIICGYSSPDAPAGVEAVAHVFAPTWDPKRKCTRLLMLPATEFASEPMIAADRLRAFLINEIAKEEAKKANITKRIELARHSHGSST